MRRTTLTLTATAIPLALVLLTGCATAADPGTAAVAPTPSATASPPPSAPRDLPDIPITGTEPVIPTPTVAPVGVTVPAADIDVDVVPVGVKPDGLMELPENVSVAGWYRYGPDTRDERGTVVIAAHVDSLKYGLGPFARLKTLSAGAEIVVTDADGGRSTWLLERIENVRKAEIPLDRVFDRAGERRLVLITCGGQFDTSSRTYSDNVLVTARPARG